MRQQSDDAQGDALVWSTTRNPLRRFAGGVAWCLVGSFVAVSAVAAIFMPEDLSIIRRCVLATFVVVIAWCFIVVFVKTGPAGAQTLRLTATALELESTYRRTVTVARETAVQLVAYELPDRSWAEGSGPIPYVVILDANGQAIMRLHRKMWPAAMPGQVADAAGLPFDDLGRCKEKELQRSYPHLLGRMAMLNSSPLIGFAIQVGGYVLGVWIVWTLYAVLIDLPNPMSSFLRAFVEYG